MPWNRTDWMTERVVQTGHMGDRDHGPAGPGTCVTDQNESTTDTHREARMRVGRRRRRPAIAG
jgi:hypothetical protein